MALGTNYSRGARKRDLITMLKMFALNHYDLNHVNKMAKQWNKMTVQELIQAIEIAKSNNMQGDKF